MQFKQSFLDVASYLAKDEVGTITVAFTTNTGASEKLADYPVELGKSLLIYCNAEPSESLLSCAKRFEDAQNESN